MKETDHQVPPTTENHTSVKTGVVKEIPFTSDEIVALKSQDRSKVRHRVIGGVILLLSLAALGPMIFDEAPVTPQSDVQTVIPPVTKESLNKIQIAVDAKLQQESLSSAPASDLGLSALDQRQDLTKVKPTENAPQVAPQDVNVHAKTPVDEGAFFIQVLATSSEIGAMKAMARFQALGFPVHSVKVQKKSATLWRVRIGHFKTRQEAEDAIEYLDRRKITHLPIQVDKSVSKPVTRTSVTEATAKEKPAGKEMVKTTATPTKNVVESAKVVPAKPVAKKEVKATVKNTEAVKPKTVIKTPAKSKPVAEKKVVTKPKVKSADPLADVLKESQREIKSASGDFIAEQIAREQKKK